MTSKRKRYSAEFKAKVALEALRGELTTAQLATKHGIHQTMVGDWKRQAMDGLTAVFADRSAAQETTRSSEAEIEKLHAKIGQLLVERELRGLTPASLTFLLAWSKRPVDEHRVQTADGRAEAPSALDFAAMRVGRDQPVRFLLPACG